MFGQEFTGISESSVIIFVGVEGQNFGGSFFGESVSRFPATVAMDKSSFAICFISFYQAVDGAESTVQLDGCTFFAAGKVTAIFVIHERFNCFVFALRFHF